jgi:hypothetical protein
MKRRIVSSCKFPGFDVRFASIRRFVILRLVAEG